MPEKLLHIHHHSLDDTHYSWGEIVHCLIYRLPARIHSQTQYLHGQCESNKFRKDAFFATKDWQLTTRAESCGDLSLIFPTKQINIALVHAYTYVGFVYSVNVQVSITTLNG